LKSKGDAIDSILAQADDAFAGFDGTMAKIGGVLPGLSDGKTEELFEKLKSLRELADTYKQKSVTFMDEGRRMLSDLSEGANNFARKIDPQSVPAAAPRRPAPRRQ
jgi:phospholipid/cholesterol/gamma-HCH transport system substrate-binding protein